MLTNFWETEEPIQVPALRYTFSWYPRAQILQGMLPASETPSGVVLGPKRFTMPIGFWSRRMSLDERKLLAELFRTAAAVLDESNDA